ncbi:nucleotide pyrophosphohydrolase [Myxococcus sp. RHSTA-1-4]|uniref:nucleotide pyrophosphohydrolase n=1 Tax=Myxococcus sp. RHSTA-1-4 TaxID=2874601 RepID=UPI001CBBB61B|nr:nucleotide pyrophosphohydrolase [Myxococcus sp. RHSTA-1-4]MBZ4418360.1 nucleotide pyrophosphohydrolase [Myxococcus sp. RHSTA-1-4]
MTDSGNSPPSDPFDALIRELRAFAAEREWAKFHDPKNLSMAVASEAGELVAILRWIRNEEADAFARDPENHARLKAEIADVAISLLLLCDRTSIDLRQAILDKLEVNRRNYPVESSRGRSDRPGRSRS